MGDLLIYSAGDNQDGQLCRDGDTLIPKLVSGLSTENLKCLSLGSAHMVAVYEDGSVYGCGRNVDGELGLSRPTSYFYPEKINVLQKIVSANCGFKFTMFLNDSGDVFIASNKNKTPIEKVKTKDKCIALFGSHTPWIMCQNGEIYSVSLETKDTIKFHFDSTKRIVDIVSISGSVLALTDRGKLYGHGSIVGVRRFVEIEFFKFTRIKKISGKYNHFVILTENSDVFVWGKNKYGQLGNGRIQDSITKNVFIKLDDFSDHNIVDIGAGGFFSMFLDANGDLYSTGYNDGRLMIGNDISYNIPTKSEIFKNVCSFICGGSSSFVILKDSTKKTKPREINKVLSKGELNSGKTEINTLCNDQFLHENGFLLSAKGIQNIIFNQFEQDNFTFIINGSQFTCNQYLADFISPNISHLHQVDPTIDYYEINFHNINDLNNNSANFTDAHFDKLMKLAKGEIVNFTNAELYIFEELSDLLGNEELLSLIEKKIPHEYTLDSIMDIMKHELQNSTRLKKDTLKYACENFYEILSKYKDELKTLNVFVIEEIISNDALKLKDEDSLLEFLLEMIDKDKSQSFLLENVNFEMLSTDSLYNFKLLFDPNTMTNKIWNQISKCLKPKANPSNSNKRYFQTYYPEEDPYHPIPIHYDQLPVFV